MLNWHFRHAWLKELCKAYGLRVSGNKTQLAERLLNHVGMYMPEFRSIPGLVREMARKLGQTTRNEVFDPDGKGCIHRALCVVLSTATREYSAAYLEGWADSDQSISAALQLRKLKSCCDEALQFLESPEMHQMLNPSATGAQSEGQGDVPDTADPIQLETKTPEQLLEDRYQTALDKGEVIDLSQTAEESGELYAQKVHTNRNKLVDSRRKHAVPLSLLITSGTGKGTVYYANGERTEGTWKNGEPDGKFTTYFPDGARTEETWENGELNGKVTSYFSDGVMAEETWKNGELIATTLRSTRRPCDESAAVEESFELDTSPEMAPDIAPPPLHMNQGLPPGWVCKASRGAVGRYYYENKELNKNQWERPSWDL